MPSSETQLARRTTAEVVTDLLRQVPVPSSAR
jgi:MoxR-like ATPase